MEQHPFRRWLDASGYTLADIARLCNVSRSAVHQWSSGHCAPTAKHLSVLHRISHGAVQAWYWTSGGDHEQQ